MIKLKIAKLKTERTNKEKGNTGEKIALKYLKKQGYKLVAKNFTALQCEIDIIVKKKDILAFVEVKSRTHDEDYGGGKEAVNYQKQYNIKKAAQMFLKKNNLWDMNIRFDIIEVELNTGNVNHLEAAFM